MNRKKIDCHDCANESCLIKKACSNSISILSNEKTQFVLKKGQSVFKEDAQVFGLFFIQKGMVKIECSDIAGKKQIVRLANRKQLLGHVTSRKEVYSVGAVAIEDTRVCFFENEVMIEAFKQNFDLTFGAMMFYSIELRKSEVRTKFLTLLTTSEKVVYALIYLIETFGVCKDSNQIKAILSRGEIAEIVGTNADQVSRTISQLRNENLIDTIGNRIKIRDLEALKRIISR